jgi:ribonuclease-3
LFHHVRQFYLLNFSKKKSEYRKLKRLTGYVPFNIDLFNRAFRHNSASKKVPNTNIKNSNERLEYLGDAVLDVIIAEELFRKFPNHGEGFLTEMRSKVVSRKQLSTLAQHMGLTDLLKMSNSLRHNPKAMQNVAGNALEALIGAIYLDKGYKRTRKMVLKKMIKPYIDFDELKTSNDNFKSVLYHFAQRNKQKLEFKVVKEEGSAHRKNYMVAAMLDGKKISTGSGFSKKNAEQRAAEKACDELNINAQTPAMSG